MPVFRDRVIALARGKPVITAEISGGEDDTYIDATSLEEFMAAAIKARAPVFYVHALPVRGSWSEVYANDMEGLTFFIWFVEQLDALGRKFGSPCPPATLEFAAELTTRYPKWLIPPKRYAMPPSTLPVDLPGTHVVSFITRGVVHALHEPVIEHMQRSMKQLGEDRRRKYALMPELLDLEASLVTSVVAELKTLSDYRALPDQRARLDFIKQHYIASYSIAIRIEETWFFSL